MTQYLGVAEVLELHQRVLDRWGGASGVDLYPDPASKAAALGFTLVRNHPFGDGNKRVGHAAAVPADGGTPVGGPPLNGVLRRFKFPVE